MKVVKKKVSVADLRKMLKSGGLDMNMPYQREYVWNKNNVNALKESVAIGRHLGCIQVAKVGRTFKILDGKQRTTTLIQFLEEGDTNVKGLKLDWIQYEDASDKECREIFCMSNAGRPITRAYLKHAGSTGINRFIDKVIDKYDFIDIFASSQDKKVSFLDKCVCMAITGKVNVQTQNSNIAHKQYLNMDIEESIQRKITSILDYMQKTMVSPFTIDAKQPNFVDLFIFCWKTGVLPSKAQWEASEGIRLRSRVYVDAISYHTTNTNKVELRHRAYKKTLF